MSMENLIRVMEEDLGIWTPLNMEFQEFRYDDRSVDTIARDRRAEARNEIRRNQTRQHLTPGSNFREVTTMPSHLGSVLERATYRILITSAIFVDTSGESDNDRRDERRPTPHALPSRRTTSRIPSKMTQRKIERSTVRFKYEKVKKTSEESEAQVDKCTVCCNDFKEREDMRRLPCLHIFHARCVDPWLKSNQNCPICRIGLTGQDPVLTAHEAPDTRFSRVRARLNN